MDSPYGDDHIENIVDFDKLTLEDQQLEDEELTPEEQQLEDDITEQMAKQGLAHDDFEGDVPVGAFIDINR
ncbi:MULTISPECIES: hypothetical protein [Psychrobacter]|uniref:hypothetical protein n=1 Tax=Psychrobacter TaxID=497 RepID=UPI001184AA9C|nr:MULTISPECIES: hypothetical protein [Psychrobacter]TSB22933.1 hypothetical protein FOR85_08000 [Psychrobacter sp. YGAH215]|tara:strand:+ start:771 stop:983 length:213 start_codon:yes stop_codon:yes gene_type:complete